MKDATLVTIALDLVLVMMVLEGVGLALLRAYRGIGPASFAFTCNLAAGFFLVLAARFALAPIPSFGLIGACLLAALCAHLLDLRMRWPR